MNLMMSPPQSKKSATKQQASVQHVRASKAPERQSRPAAAAPQSATSPPALGLTLAGVLALQRKVGNQAVVRLLGRQARREVSEPATGAGLRTEPARGAEVDEHEREAAEEATQVADTDSAPGSSQTGRRGGENRAPQAAPSHVPPVQRAAHAPVIQRATDEELEESRLSLERFKERFPTVVELLSASPKEHAKEFATLFQQLGALVQTTHSDMDYYEKGVLTELRGFIAALDAKIENELKIKQTPDIRDTLQAHASALDKYIKIYQIPEALPQELRNLFPVWLGKRMAGAKPSEKTTLLHHMGYDDLRSALEQYDAHLKGEAQSEQAVDPRRVGAEVEEKILNSKTLGHAIAENYLRGTIAENIVALDDDTFTEVYFRQDLERNQKIYAESGLNPRILLAKKIDNVEGFQYEDKMFIRRGNNSLATPIHEAMHQLGKLMGGGEWKRQLGHPMEEGAAEMLALRICEEYKIEAKLEGYYNEYALLETIMEKCKISEETLIRAYLSGNPTEVVAAIIKVTGREGLDALTQNKDGYDAYNAWANVYKEKTKCLVQ
jgi:hypothetical protein